jgi:thiazole synthase
MIRIILADSSIPVIVDAGLRAPSDAALAMELGCSAVLVNSAIAAARDPIEMAVAFAEAVGAGRRAFRAGLMERSAFASATSPLTTFLDSSSGTSL